MASDDALKVVLLVLGVLLILPLFLMGFMVPMMGYMGGMPFGAEAWGFGLFGFASLIPLAFFALLLYAAYRILSPSEDRDPAIEALREAYAKGEIDEEEYERRFEKLRQE